ncbi:MAG TPA: adenylate/guanylate cyclase domain-containing protein [Nitrospirae bacterium]|nr:adenylate/guanylate cyclase domain-containing protein [Nitrospirota bacterium]
MRFEQFIKNKAATIQSEIVWSFLRLDIAKKMILGYIPLTALMLIIAVFSLSSLDRLYNLNKWILNTDIVIIDTSERMIDALLSQELFAQRYMIVNSPEMHTMYIERKNDFNVLLKRLAGIEDVPYINAQEMENSHEEYGLLLDEEFNLAKEQRALPKVLTDRIAAKQEALMAMLNLVSENARKDQNNKTRIATNIGDTAFKVVVFLCIIGTILALAAAVLITRNISGNILKLRQATEKVAGGKFDDLPKIKSKDELGDLSSAFESMAQRLKRLEEMYMDASPLTYLPGGVAIENVLKKRIETSLPLSFCMLDLDNFKAVNDRHGYATGNSIINATADVIDMSVKEFGNPDDFIGHIGGDDFVVLTTPDRHINICNDIMEKFDANVKIFYTEEEVKKGYISGHTRQGKPAKFPLVTISIAVVTNLSHKFNSHIEIGEIAADLKEYAKSLKGSVYVVDRRKDKVKAGKDKAPS